jgi:hypothetical protein
VRSGQERRKIRLSLIYASTGTPAGTFDGFQIGEPFKIMDWMT